MILNIPLNLFIAMNIIESFHKVVPITEWLPKYKLAYLRGDIIAGITLAFFVIPVSMAYATLAGLPPQTGIYCYLFAGLLYMLFGTSRQLAIGPTSAISVVVGTSIGAIAGGDPAKALIMASTIALFMAGFFFIAYLIRLSALINFISDTILLGFKAGVALVIASTQLPTLFGIEASGSNFFYRLVSLATHLGEMNVYVLSFGLAAFTLLMIGNYYFKGKPVSLVIVILSILAVTFLGLKDYGIRVVGEIPQGIPAMSIPSLAFADINDLLSLAMACFFLSYIESISAARALALQHGHEVDSRQELLALGFANLASSVGNGYAVAGGLSQSTVNDRSGARSLLSLFFTSCMLLLSLQFLTGLLSNLPLVMLAVIVLDAVIGLINLHDLRHLYKVSRSEFRVSVLTIIAVLVLGVLQGVVIAVILSIIFLLKKNATPHIAVLQRIPGTTLFSDVLRHPDNEPVQGVLILRPESSILYFNIAYIRAKIKNHVSNYQGSLALVIIDLSSANYVDVSGARFLVQMEDELEKENIRLRIVDALGSVRDILRAEKMEEEIGHISRKVTINDILEEFRNSS